MTAEPGNADRGIVLAVCVATNDVILDGVGASGINKTPTDVRQPVGPLGLAADHVVDHKHHGGIDQAVYAYSEHEAHRWADELGYETPAGWFGENLRTDGLQTSDAIVGEQWRIGEDLVVECTIPRVPCRTFAVWTGERTWVKRFMQRADVGTYLLVRSEGTVAAGDPVSVIYRPDHGVRVRDLLTGNIAPAKLRALLDESDLPVKVARDARKWLERGTV